eukprot:jgi/Mesen1/1473/ME000132S00414
MTNSKLTGQIALIAGGSGTVGSAIVKAFLQAGATVVVPSRGKERLDKLKQEFGSPSELHTVDADAGSEDGIQVVLKYIDDNLGGKLNHVVSSLGSGVWNTTLVGDQPVSLLTQAMYDNCASHYVVATATLKRIADVAGASYLFISGSLATSFFEGAGFNTVSGAALGGLSLAVRAEMKEKAVRVNELRIYFMVKRGTPASANIGTLAAALAAGTTSDQVIHAVSEAFVADSIASPPA